MAGSAVAPFLWGPGGQALTPEQVARQRERAAALLNVGVDTSPVGHWLQGLARVANSAAGAFGNWRANEAEKAGREGFAKEFEAAFGGGGNDVASALLPSQDIGLGAGSPADMDAYRNAIASIESAGSGDYSAIGPTHDTLGRALGKYQIMEANIAPWAREALGREVTADEFLANPELQDAIFDHRFGQYVQKYGPAGAAQAWLGGEGGVGKLGRTDALGTSIGDYSNRFMSALGGGNPRQQVAQALIPDFDTLTKLASNPWASPEQKAIISAIMGQQLEQQAQANDPLRQLQIQQAQTQLDMAPLDAAYKQAQTDALRAKPPVQPTDDEREYERAKAEGFQGSFLDFVTEVKRAGATNISNTVGGESLTPGWKKIDEGFAETYLGWNSGGWADTQKQLSQISEAIDILDQSGDVTGAVGLLPREVGAFFNPDGTVARENIEEVVQRSLREILGAQFTEKEGERLIARAFNPLLPPEENKKRAKRLFETIKGMAESKQAMVDYFDKEGTLRGYTGGRVSLGDVQRLADEFGPAPDEGNAAHAAGAPAVGTVEDGYRFKGGDPTDPNNWEKV